MYKYNFRSKFIPRRYSRRLCSTEISKDTVQSGELASSSNELNAVDIDAAKEKNLKYEKLADISRMKKWHKNLLHNQMTDPNEFKWQQERWALKERYAKYGRASGVEPGLMWPSADELKEKVSEEKELCPQLFETVKQAKEMRLEEKRERLEKVRQFEKNLAKYPKQLEEFREKLKAKQTVSDEGIQKKKEQIQEIQDYFGYAIEPSDPRFVAMLQKKEMEERKLAKQAKKKEREISLVEKLQSFASAMSQQAASEKKEEKKEDSST